MVAASLHGSDQFLEVGGRKGILVWTVLLVLAHSVVVLSDRLGRASTKVVGVEPAEHVIRVFIDLPDEL